MRLRQDLAQTSNAAEGEARMTHWHIQSGELKGEAEADTAEKAFLLLLDSETPQSLSRIVKAYKINADGKKAYGTTVYGSTEAILRRAGLWDRPPRPSERKGSEQRI